MFSKKDLMNMEGIMMLHAIKKSYGKRNAAKFLNTSIDTLNKYVNNLESELGVKLVASDEKGCTLTPKGEKVVAIADVLKQHLQQAYAIVPSETNVKGEVRIAYERDARSNMYVCLEELLEQSPDLSLFIDTFDKAPDMHKMAYDICMSYTVPKGEDLVVVYSRKVKFGFFASSEYLAKHSYPQDLNDLLKNHRLLVKNEGWWQTPEAKKLQQKAEKGICFSNSTFVVNDLAISGSGIAIMPLNFVRGGHGMVCLDNIPCSAEATIYLITHRTIKDIPKIRTVLNYYKKMLEAL